MSRPVRAATARARQQQENSYSRKRQRTEEHLSQFVQQQQQHQQQQAEQPPSSQTRVLFLPTHLSLLRALHTDDGDAESRDVPNTDRHCPSWREINSFIKTQPVMMENDAQAKRATAVLRTLGGPLAAGVSSKSRLSGVRTGPAHRPSGRDIAQHPGGPDVGDQATMSGVTASATHAGQGGADRPSSKGGTQSSTRFPSRLAHNQKQTHHLNIVRDEGACCPRPGLDPRAVVCTVLRRAVMDSEAENSSAYAGLASFKRDVDETVERLGSSLKALSRKRQDRMTLRGVARGDSIEKAIHGADVIECEQSKLQLWRHLQSSLLARRSTKR